ncbi:MAG: hypothetical protein ACR2GX_00075 [Candidatus Dormibacteria bacterium]
MTILRISNGSDIGVTPSLDEVLATLGAASADGFVEFAGEDGPVHLRASSVIAVLGDQKKGTAGFRVGINSRSSDS